MCGERGKDEKEEMGGAEQFNGPLVAHISWAAIAKFSTRGRRRARLIIAIEEAAVFDEFIKFDGELSV